MDGSHLITWGREAMAAEAQALSDSALRMNEAFAGAVQTMLQSAGKVVVTGLGKSGHVGRKIASTLSSTGTSAAFLHPSEALHGDFGMLQKSDCLLAIAYGGETHEVVEVAKFARRLGIPVIALTGKAESSLAQLATFVMDAHVSREADPLNLAPTCSSTVTMALGDALAVSLMRARGFGHGDFAFLHPGGSLGRRLSRVGDHMHSGTSLPRLEVDADFHTVLKAVTVDNFGIAAVIDGQGHLVGAISDGDLRRSLLALGAGALECRAADLMSPKPKVIKESALALDAVRQMNEAKISRLFVVDHQDDHLVKGLVRLQDLLIAKIL